MDRWTKRNQKRKINKNIARSEASEHREIQVFEKILRPGRKHSNDQTFLVGFLSDGHEKMN